MGFYIVISIWSAYDINKMKNIVISKNERIKMYKKAIPVGLIPVIAVLIFCSISSISFNDIGLRKLNFQYNIWFTVITFIVSGGFLLLLIQQIISYFVSIEFREQVKKQFANDSSKNHYEAVMNNLLPRSKKEKLLWFFNSLEAGIGEEIVFRGFFFYILYAIFPGASLIIIMVMLSIVFGFFHIYQGISGVIKTSIFGAIYGSLYLVTDSIIPVIIFHFLTDFSASFRLSDELEK
jgi:membrane protease YdiL (CAAX protease family)